ncbi:unnamed protein product, partial [Pocillopora meandrina]
FLTPIKASPHVSSCFANRSAIAEMKSLILSLLIGASAILAESQFDHAARSEFLNDENKVTNAKDESRPHQPIIEKRHWPTWNPSWRPSWNPRPSWYP